MRSEVSKGFQSVYSYDISFSLIRVQISSGYSCEMHIKTSVESVSLFKIRKTQSLHKTIFYTLIITLMNEWIEKYEYVINKTTKWTVKIYK